MTGLATSLEVTRIMGKMESARLSFVKAGLEEFIDDLESFQLTVANGLKEIERLNQGIQHSTSWLLNNIENGLERI